MFHSIHVTEENLPVEANCWSVHNVFYILVMFSKLKHLGKKGRKSISLNETKIYALELKYALKNNPEVKFQREQNKIQERILNTITDNCIVDCKLMVSCRK